MSDDDIPIDPYTLRIAPELEGKTREELRFWRLIEEVVPTWTVTLACGHSSVWVTEPLVRYAPCAQCVNGWVGGQMRANK